MKRKRYHWLSYIINQEGYEVGAEVGAATGVTTGYLLRHCPTLAKLIVVDDWRPIPGSGQWEMDNMERIFRNRFPNEERLTILKGLSWEMASNIKDNSLDFVFIDASHDKESFVKDFKAWAPKVKYDGLICGHDLHFKGVSDGLAELVVRYNKAGIDNCWYIFKDQLEWRK